MTCVICRSRPARPKIGPGPAPIRCAKCKFAHVEGGRQKIRLAEATERISVRLASDSHAIRRLPRNYCRCAQPMARLEDGVLLVCGLCSREVAALKGDPP